MNLHENRSAFEELVTATAENLKIDERIVEKDYYVTLLLKITGLSAIINSKLFK